jgi:hypothetical protein
MKAAAPEYGSKRVIRTRNITCPITSEQSVCHDFSLTAAEIWMWLARIPDHLKVPHICVEESFSAGESFLEGTGLGALSQQPYISTYYTMISP